MEKERTLKTIDQSVTSVLSKVLEKLILSQINSQLILSHINVSGDPPQHRKLLIFSETICSKTENNEFVSSASLNLSNAFDSPSNMIYCTRNCTQWVLKSSVLKLIQAFT